MAQIPTWGNPVLDLHLHPRKEPATELEHMAGCGTTKAVLLPNYTNLDRAVLVKKQYPDRFVRFTNVDIMSPDAGKQLEQRLKEGAIGVGELKREVAVDGPEMRRVYDVATAFQVPVLIHFQEPNFNSGIRRLPALLKAYPNLTFLAHANSWWANISADVDDNVAYPKGKIKPGGLSDKLLADYPNIYGDLSAFSGLNAMSRDPEFAAAFVARHPAKLIFGSDCGCRDGRGTDQPQPTVTGKCVARETLTALKKMTTPELFRRITWENGTKLLKIRT